MLIQSGRVSALATLPWVALELGRDTQPDELALSLVRWAVTNLEAKSKPFQILYPIESRYPIRLASPHFWMRTMDISDLAPISRSLIQGLRSHITGIVSDPDGRPILVDDAFVQDLITRVRSASDGWSTGITIGSGVRILLGSGHGLCGIVEAIFNDVEAVVRIALRSRAIRLRVPIRALRNLGNVPDDYFVKEEL